MRAADISPDVINGHISDAHIVFYKEQQLIRDREFATITMGLYWHPAMPTEPSNYP